MHIISVSRQPARSVIVHYSNWLSLALAVRESAKLAVAPQVPPVRPATGLPDLSRGAAGSGIEWADWWSLALRSLPDGEENVKPELPGVFAAAEDEDHALRLWVAARKRDLAQASRRPEAGPRISGILADREGAATRATAFRLNVIAVPVEGSSLVVLEPFLVLAGIDLFKQRDSFHEVVASHLLRAL